MEIPYGRNLLTFGQQVQIHEPVILLKPEMIDIGYGSRIDSFVKIEGGQGVRIGPRVHIASFCHLNIGGGSLIIEEGANVSSGAKIITGTNDPDMISCSAMSPAVEQKVIRSETIIKENACVFAGVILLPGVTLGVGSRIAAGAVVPRDTTVPAWEIWAGVPARFLRKCQ